MNALKDVRNVADVEEARIRLEGICEAFEAGKMKRVTSVRDAWSAYLASIAEARGDRLEALAESAPSQGS